KNKHTIIFDLLDSRDKLADEILNYFFVSPTFNINHCHKTHTTLTVPILWFLLCSVLVEDLSYVYKLKLARLQILLDKGADPELSGSTGMAPLTMARAANNQEIITMLEKAIAHKKAQATQKEETVKREDAPKKRA